MFAISGPMYIPYITDKPVFWSRVFGVLAFITCIFVGINMYLFKGIQGLQRQLAERQQLITQTTQAQELARELVGAMTNLAAKNNDGQLKQLLAAHGISLSADSSTPLESRGK
jgi:hypothetical protein